MALKIIGALIIGFGLIDLIGSHTGLDVWTDWLNINLPEFLWKFSSYIEIALGGLLFKLGSPDTEEKTSPAE